MRTPPSCWFGATLRGVELTLTAEAGPGEDPGLELFEWLRRTRAEGVDVSPATGEGRLGTMDGGLTAVVAVLSSTAVVELARGIHTWLQSRVNKVTLRISAVDRERNITVESTQPVEEIVAAIRQLQT